LPDRAKIAEYRAAVLACHMARQILQLHELPTILDAIERAGAIGPVLDPTLYRDKAKAMEEDREILRAAMALWSFVPGKGS
jgi:hypothetical protein